MTTEATVRDPRKRRRTPSFNALPLLQERSFMELPIPTQLAATQTRPTDSLYMHTHLPVGFALGEHPGVATLDYRDTTTTTVR